MKEWMDKTCLKFEPHSAQLADQLGHNRWILLKGTGGACASLIGMDERIIKGTPQFVSTAEPAYSYIVFNILPALVELNIIPFDFVYLLFYPCYNDGLL